MSTMLTLSYPEAADAAFWADPAFKEHEELGCMPLRLHKCRFCDDDVVYFCKSPNKDETRRVLCCLDCIVEHDFSGDMGDMVRVCHFCEMRTQERLPSQDGHCDSCGFLFSGTEGALRDECICHCSRIVSSNRDFCDRWHGIRTLMHNGRRFYTCSCCGVGTLLDHEKNECAGLPQVPDHHDD